MYVQYRPEVTLHMHGPYTQVQLPQQVCQQWRMVCCMYNTCVSIKAYTSRLFILACTFTQYLEGYTSRSLLRTQFYVRIYSTAHFKLDDTRVQQLHGSTRFQKRTQHFPRAHDRPMTYYHWKLHACMHETFVLLACVA